MTTINKKYSKQYRQSNPRNKIFIGGLAGDSNESDLINYFEQYSKIDDCVVMIDKVTNHSRGFGFVTIEDSSKVDTILNSQPHVIKGKRVECKKAIPKEEIQNDNDRLAEEMMKRKQSIDAQFYSRKLFVGGLSVTWTEEELIRYFAQYGEVESCLIKRDDDTGKSRGKCSVVNVDHIGFGFILFVNKESIKNVLAHGKNHYLMGKWIECKQAHPKEFAEMREGNKAIGIYPLYPPNYPNQQSLMFNPYLNNMERCNNSIRQNQLMTQLRPNSNNPSIRNSFGPVQQQLNASSFINPINLFEKSFINRKPPSLPLVSGEKSSQPFPISQGTDCCFNAIEGINSINRGGMLNQSEANTIEDRALNTDINSYNSTNSVMNEQGTNYNPNRRSDIFTNYFDKSIKNPECNSYMNYKLFNSGGDEVSQLAYRNEEKVQLFTDSNNVESVNEDPSQLFNQPQTSNDLDYNHWKQTRNFRLKSERHTIEHSNGQYKPY